MKMKNINVNLPSNDYFPKSIDTKSLKGKSYSNRTDKETDKETDRH